MEKARYTVLGISLIILSFYVIGEVKDLLHPVMGIHIVAEPDNRNDIEIPHQSDHSVFEHLDKLFVNNDLSLSFRAIDSGRFFHEEDAPIREFSVAVWQPPKF